MYYFRNRKNDFGQKELTLTSLKRVFFLMMIFTWLALILGFFFIQKNSKDELAISILDSARESLMVGDNRSAMVIFGKGIPQWFQSIIVYRGSNEVLFSLNKTCGLCIKLRKPIWFVEGSKAYGRAEFSYSVSYLLSELLAGLTLSTFILFIFYQREVHKLQLAWELEKKMSSLEAENNLAKQVGHDIRSPLSAIKMICHLPDMNTNEVRNLLHRSADRINAIAQELLNRSKRRHLGEDSIYSLEDVDMLALISNLVKEKQLEYFDKATVKIYMLSVDKNIYAKVNRLDFERVVSNLINNSVEAAPKDSLLEIIISIVSEVEKVKIEIKDNGIGMSEDLLENIGHQKISFGKPSLDSGSGIGVFHAFTAIEKMGGKINYQSKLNFGTSVVITFKKV